MCRNACKDQQYRKFRILKKHGQLFDGKIGTVKGHMVRIHIPAEVVPKHWRPRPVPLALQQQVTAYRNTPQRSTRRTPAELMFGRHTRTIFDQLKPDIHRNIDNELLKQKKNFDKNVKEKSFDVRDKVWVNDPLSKGSSAGNIVKQTAPYSYIVDIAGQHKRKHADQMRHRYLPANDVGTSTDREESEITLRAETTPNSNTEGRQQRTKQSRLTILTVIRPLPPKIFWSSVLLHIIRIHSNS